MTAEELAALYYDAIVLCLAGGIAQKICGRASAPGFYRLQTRQQKVAAHESGHLVCAAVLKWPVAEGSIVPCADAGTDGHTILASSELTAVGAAAHAEQVKRSTTGPAPSDREQVIRLCWDLSGLTDDGRPRWKRSLALKRSCTQYATALVERNLPYVRQIAGELERKRTIGPAELEAIRPRLRRPGDPE